MRADVARTTRAVLPPLDERAPALAPVTRSRLARLAGAQAAVWLLGLGLTLLAPAPLADAGASLAAPGGAHLAAGRTVAFLVVVAALSVAVLVWWMIGAYVAPFVVWGVDLVVVAVVGHGDVRTGPGLVAAFALVPAVWLLCLAVHAVRHRVRLRRAAALNPRLAAADVRVTVVPSVPVPPTREASPDDLARLRHALDLALQPIDAFEGFDRRDEFREAALRYQLCILGFALAAYRNTVAPAFSGYVAEAQSNAILKMGDRRVWGYWALENAWGRLRLDRDPVVNRDNVMLTGWQGVAVGMFETFEDDRFSRPGGLTYRWSDDEEYAHDFPSLAASVAANLRRSPFTLFSCEPRWIYPVCNTFGLNTLLLHDRLHGTSDLAELRGPALQALLQEFHRPDGRVIGVRSETVGLSWSPWSGDGVWLPTTYWLHPIYPELAHRSWWLLRHTVLREEDGRFTLPPTLANRCDSGSYAFGKDTFGQVLLAMASREVGDEEVAAATMHHLEQTQPVVRSAGAARYDGLSTQGNLYELMARFGRTSGLRDLLGHGVPDAWRTGPRLADAAYPDVLVARAVTDGEALHCVLRPGRDARRVTVEVDRLRPHRRYRTLGGLLDDVVADADGRALVELDLGGRTELTVSPC